MIPVRFPRGNTYLPSLSNLTPCDNLTVPHLARKMVMKNRSGTDSKLWLNPSTSANFLPGEVCALFFYISTCLPVNTFAFKYIYTQRTSLSCFAFSRHLNASTVCQGSRCLSSFYLWSPATVDSVRPGNRSISRKFPPRSGPAWHDSRSKAPAFGSYLMYLTTGNIVESFRNQWKPTKFS